MYEQTPESIKKFLQQEEVQERIYQRIQRTMSHITVPIGGAVSLLGFSENRLRKWEEKGLLSPLREGTHRHYTLQDLDKLAIIRELIDAQFSPGSIPSDIDRIWASIVPSDKLAGVREHYDILSTGEREEAGYQHINQRIERARQGLFWSYYASHALRLSLQLIRESIPGTERTFLGLILPFQVDTLTFATVTQVDQLPALKESLVGWLALSGSSHALLTPTPSFEHPDQHRLYQLRAMQEGMYTEERATDHTLLIVDWGLSKLTLQNTTVKIIHRLLAPLYTNEQAVRSCFSQGWRDLMEPATDLNSEYIDYILNGLADMVVRLGTIAGRQKWRFCCILIPSDDTLPLQRRSLVVRAQSTRAMHRVGTTLVSPNISTISLSLRAFQSGQVVYRQEIYEEDDTIALRDLENHPVSAIAVPVEGENDTPSAVLYVVADEPHAFHLDDQRILRLVGRMVQEALATYKIRQQAVTDLTDTIVHPEAIDPFFSKKGFLSEDVFAQDIEELLRDIQAKTPKRNEKGSSSAGQDTVEAELSSTDAISLISIEVDHQASLANRYGDQFSQNLSRAVGSYLQTQLLRIFTDLIDYKLYYAYVGRFYILLKELSLEEARKHAERIRRRLNDSYEVSVLRSINEVVANTNPETMQIVTLSVHVGVSCYTREKLEDLLQRYSTKTAAGNVRALISRDIDNILNKGRQEGGNNVISWNPGPDRRGYIRWAPNLASP